MKGAKITNRDHLQALGEIDDGPELPATLDYVYSWFVEVFIGQPISFQELKAWSELKGIELQGWEARVIRKLARIWI